MTQSGVSPSKRFGHYLRAGSEELARGIFEIEQRLMSPFSVAMRDQPSPPENSMSSKLDALALDQLFRTARTRNGWTDRPVTEEQLRELYDLMKFGPTSSNSCPARFVWIRSAEGKSRLAALAAPTNAPKILAAPVTVIVGYDLDFAEQLPKLFPALQNAGPSRPIPILSTGTRPSKAATLRLLRSQPFLSKKCVPPFEN
jgi:hypothetical protein